MDQERQGRRSVPTSQQGPQLPNYMKQPASRASAARNAAQGSRDAGKPARTSSGAARSGNGGRRKRRQSRSQKLMRLAIGVFGVLIVIVAGILLLSGRGSNDQTMLDYMESNKKFVDGVTVAGVDVSGLQMEEAKPLVEQAVSTQLGTVSIILQHEDRSWTLTATDMGLRANTDDILLEAMAYGRGGLLGASAEERETLEGAGKAFDVTFTPDTTSVSNRIAAIAAEANVAPVEPYLVPSLSEDNVQSFEPVEGKKGLTVNAEQSIAKVIEAVANGEYQKVIEPVYDTVEPTMTLAFLQENTKRISSYTTRFPTSSSDEVVKNRVFNIKKAAARINCYVAQPDEEWSFNDWVGPRTKETGWKEANGISGGKEYTLQAGGGICQVSTTLYNALLSGNIPVTDRTAHSIPSSYVDKGLDATVDTSGIDLKFNNDTGAPIYIFVYITPDASSSRYLNITVSLYGKPLPEGVTYKPRSEITETTPRTEITYVDDTTIPVGYQLEKVKAHDGYKAKAYVDKYVNGKLEETIYLYEDKYRGNNAEVHVGTGDPLTVPVPEGATLVPGATPIESPDASANGDADGVSNATDTTVG